MKVVNTLLLEDDIKTLKSIFEVLERLEESKEVNFSLTVLPDYKKVENYINRGEDNFDLILLDRDCFLGGSFHVLNFERLGANKVIGISSVPSYNIELQARGVKRIVGKDYSNLEDFKKRLSIKISELIK